MFLAGRRLHQKSLFAGERIFLFLTLPLRRSRSSPSGSKTANKKIRDGKELGNHKKNAREKNRQTSGVRDQATSKKTYDNCRKKKFPDGT